jgi:hypothetical protein
MRDSDRQLTRLRQLRVAAVEVAFIIFLFYANLLMGEFTRTNGVHHTVAFALRDIFPGPNFAIGFVAACLGHAVFEFLRRRL